MNPKLRYKIPHQKSRGATSWSIRESLGIRLWFFIWLLCARWTPKKFNSWRLFLLRLFGAQIVGRPFVFPSVRIYVPWNLVLFDKACIGPDCMVYSLGRVILRERCVVSHETYLCGGTHDFEKENFPLMIGDIDVGRNVFLGARAFVLPGVTIGDGSRVGACAVVTKDVGVNDIIAGNPGRSVKKT